MCHKAESGVCNRTIYLRAAMTHRLNVRKKVTRNLVWGIQMSASFNEKTNENYWAGVGLGAIFLGAAIYVGWHVENQWLNVTICMAGSAVGWFIGILISPSSSDEAERFRSYGKAILTFLSGYVIAKFDPLVAGVVARHDPHELYVLSVQILLLILTLTIGALTTFAGRGFGSAKTSAAGAPSDRSHPPN